MLLNNGFRFTFEEERLAGWLVDSVKFVELLLILLRVERGIGAGGCCCCCWCEVGGSGGGGNIAWLFCWNCGSFKLNAIANWSISSSSLKTYGANAKNWKSLILFGFPSGALLLLTGGGGGRDGIFDFIFVWLFEIFCFVVVVAVVVVVESVEPVTTAIELFELDDIAFLDGFSNCKIHLRAVKLISSSLLQSKRI